MRLHTYLNYPGTCAEAFRFYEQHLGAKIGMIMTHNQTPGGSGIAPEFQDKVLHASLELGGARVMASDVTNAQPTRSSYLSLSVDTDAEAERIYAALSDGGEIFVPLQETFFATRFAQLRDRFGIAWMVIHEKPMGPPA
jgi:PhnB protein